MARRIKLATMKQIADENASIYRLARSGELDLADACRFSAILSNQKNIVEKSAIEEKLDALERVLLATNVTPFAKRIT